MSTYSDALTALGNPTKLEIVTNGGSYLVQNTTIQVTSTTNGIAIKDNSGTANLVYIAHSQVVSVLKK
jgi:hypothetical protein